jgi:hypothetical protein
MFLEDHLQNQQGVDYFKDEITGPIKKKIKGEIADKITDYSTEKISNIALARFNKANFIANNAPFSTNVLNDYYTYDPKIIEQLKDKKNWGKIIKGNGTRSLEYYSKNGTKMQILGFIKQAKEINKNSGTLFEFFDLVKLATEDSLDTDNPLTFPGLSLFKHPLVVAFVALNDIAGMLVKQLKDEQDAFLQEDIQQDIDKAKLLGLEATRLAKNSWHHKFNTWKLLPIYNDTASKLLLGEFETLNDLISFDSNIIDELDKNITILYRTMANKNKEVTIDIIESIFLNE